jgi:hypothetical protein
MSSQQSDTRLRVDTTPRQSPPALDSDVPSLTSPSQSPSLSNALKVDSDTSLEQQNEDEMPPKEPRESSVAPRVNDQPTNTAPSKHGISPQPPTLPNSEESHASPLDDLLSPTTTPASQTKSFVRDSVAGSDFGEVRLDDDERFSTVSLNTAAARGSTVAVISPVHEKVQRLWEEEEPPLAPSEVPNTSVRASLLLQRLGNDTTPSRRSLDGQQKLQEVFERAQRDSKDLEGELASVDWGECFSALFGTGLINPCIAFWGSVVSGALFSTHSSQSPHHGP